MESVLCDTCPKAGYCIVACEPMNEVLDRIDEELEAEEEKAAVEKILGNCR